MKIIQELLRTAVTQYGTHTLKVKRLEVLERLQAMRSEVQ
jgi:hypothetical protein